MSREDFVFMRKNITIDDIFNVAFITSLTTLFFSRLFYVLFHFDFSFLNPFVFFLIPYFPGLSLLGSVIGGVLSVLIITKQKKFPRGRFLDFFSYAFLSVLPISYLGYVFIGEKQPLLFSLLPVFYYTFLFFFFLKILLPKFLQGQMRDGMLGLLILMNYSLFTAALLTIRLVSEKKSLLQPELGVLLAVFFVSIIFYIRQGAQLTFRRGK